MRRIALSGLLSIAVLAGLAVPAVAAAGGVAGSDATAGRMVGNGTPQNRPAWSGTAAHEAVGPAYLGGPGDLLLGNAGKISCSSPTFCMAVGARHKNSYGDWLATATVLRAGSWHNVAVRTRGGSDQQSALLNVSCKSATFCFAVGQYGSDPTAPQPFAAVWNGSSLTTIDVPMPAITSRGLPTAVSCVAVGRCVIAGSSAVDNRAGQLVAVAVLWTWIDGKWAVRTAPDPGAVLLYYRAAHCMSLTSCVLGGMHEPYDPSTNSYGYFTPVVTTWNGSTLTSMKPSLPAGTSNANGSWISDVSCVSGHSCAAVGAWDSGGLSEYAFLDVWNGSAWKLAQWAGPHGSTAAELDGVSCVTPSNCVAVGGWASLNGRYNAAAALTWNGRHWSATSVPAPAKGKASAFTGVNCPKAGECVAFGNTGVFYDTAGTPISGLWNGTAWRLRAA